jgi:hypothetical protein
MLTQQEAGQWLMVLEHVQKKELSLGISEKKTNALIRNYYPYSVYHTQSPLLKTLFFAFS